MKCLISSDAGQSVKPRTVAFIFDNCASSLIRV